MAHFLIKARRYVKFSCQYAAERLRGLDFTMPAASEDIRASKDYNGYTKTPEGHVERLLRSLDIDYAKSGFLDVGCGKGAVLKVASRFSFQRTAGIELDADLVETARRNMRILGLDDVDCIHANAVDFDGYGDYDVFFLFNPFSHDVLSDVLDAILSTFEPSPREIHVIYHHPLHCDLLERAGLRREGVFHDELKDYDTYVYTNRA